MTQSTCKETWYFIEGTFGGFTAARAVEKNDAPTNHNATAWKLLLSVQVPKLRFQLSNASLSSSSAILGRSSTRFRRHMNGVLSARDLRLHRVIEGSSTSGGRRTAASSFPAHVQTPALRRIGRRRRCRNGPVASSENVTVILRLLIVAYQHANW